MPGIRKPIPFLVLVWLSATIACLPITEGTGEDEVADEDADETETGTETDADPMDETGTETEADMLGSCEVMLEQQAGDHDCAFAVACSDMLDRSIACDVDGCACLEADVEVESCADSIAVCAAHDLTSIIHCCGWEL